MKYVFIFLAFLPALLSAQNRPVSDVPETAKERALADFNHNIETGSLKLYVLGGIVSALTKKDKEFEKEYAVSYHDFGCVAPADFTYYAEYNELVIGRLQKKYGIACLKNLNDRTLRRKEKV